MPRLATPTPHLVAAALGLALAGTALAAGDGGIKIGEGRLHPYFELEGRWNSNVLYSQSARTSDLILHFRPGFKLEVPGQMVAVDLDANVDWNQYLGLQSRQTTDLSKLYANATLGLGVNRNGALGLELTDGFRRSDTTPSLSIGAAVISDLNDLEVKVPIRPGGGALMLTLGGSWILESFEALTSAAGCTTSPLCDPAQVSRYGYSQYGGQAEANWKFLPKTALVLDGGYFTRQPTNTTASVAVSGWRIAGGLAGLVTPRFATTIKGGYGATTAGPTHSTWLADVEVEYVTPGPVGARLGYVHDYHADPGIDYAVYGFHRVYAQGKLLVAGRLTLRITGDWERAEYVQNAATAQILHVEPAVDFEVLRWLVLTAGNATTFRTASVTTIPAFNYTQNETYLRATFTY
jgi:hypothetical protein